MEITNISSFLPYWENIRGRTMRVVRCIPADKIDWTYAAGKFTLGDLVRHLATIERYMYAETVAGRPSAYAGCGPELADGLHQVIAYIERLHRESLEIFAALAPADLQKKCTTPEGAQITTWKWLRAMVEHECHHRGQIYLYLSMLGIATPPIFGLTSEQVRDRSTRS
jgi:uncharacterized damage-inducible protein DinB